MKTIILILTFLIIGFQLFSQEIGFPFIRNYSAKEYKGSPQIFIVLQDKNTDILYFGLVELGVMSYDGVSWKKIPIKDNSTIYGMTQTDDGVIYVGAIDNFGYLKTELNGETKYQDLTYLINDTTIKIGSVYSVSNTLNEVYFRTPDNIFQYIPKTSKINVYSANENGFFRGDFIFNNIFYTRLTNKGLMKIENNSLIEVSNTELFDNNMNFNKAVPISKSEIFIPTRTKGLFTYNFINNNLSPIDLKNQTFFEDNNIYCTKNINDTLIALGSMKKGLYVYNKLDSGNIINEDNLLQNNNVRNIITDLNKNMWLGLDIGISKVDYNFDWTFWNKQNGLNNFIINVLRFNETIYIATFQNIYYLDKNNKPQEIKDIPSGENWVLFEFNLGSTKKLLAGTQTGIFEINETSANQIYTGGGANYILQSNKNPERIISTDFHNLLGLISLKFENNNWIFEGKWEGIKDEIRGIVEDKNGNLWLGTYANGIIRVEPDFENITNPKTIKYYKQDKGLPNINSCLPYLYNDKILIATKKGIYFYNDLNDNFEPFKDFGEQFCDGSQDVAFIKFANNKIYISAWNNKTNKIGYLQTTKSGKFEWINYPFCRLPEIEAIECVYVEPSGIFWVGGSDGLFRYEPSKDIKNYNQNFKCLIRQIKSNDSILFYGNIPNSKDFINNFELEYKNNNIQFNFAAPFFDSEELTKYSFFLEGFDNQWSEWQIKTEKEYTNLEEGNYIFNVKAKNIYGIESNIAIYKITIHPPWYRTLLAYIIYFLLFTGLIFLLIKLFTRRLIKQKEKLEIVVKERTQEIVEKNEELHQQNEEILAQKDELERINSMLEKLSIVASETDNAVMIMDKDGNFEWINEGFVRLYGYNFDEFVEILGKNIFSVSSNDNIKQILEKCKTEKISVIYESQTKAKNNSNIWVQTTLTPILDSFNKITKFVAIDSDIRKLKEYEYELSSKNEQIRGSIRYAQTIQKAILPFKEKIDKNFDNFIIFRPKDIVSGDFYWYTNLVINDKRLMINENSVEIESKLNINHSSLITQNLIGVFDCTGHGVPGAFMSMIGNTLINEIVNSKHIYDTAEILTNLHKLIVISLRQEESENNDGMDVCLCRIDKYIDKTIINFTGAKRPLFFYKQGFTEIETVKGNRKSIGGTQKKLNQEEFVSNEIVFETEGIIYLSSDGYTDQNNPERRKFGSNQLTNMIFENKNKSMNEQGEIYNQAIVDWMNGDEQRDDITLIGIKI